MPLGYTIPHKRYGTALKCIEKSRQWFIVSLALWSCAIAGAETRERQLEDTLGSRNLETAFDRKRAGPQYRPGMG